MFEINGPEAATLVNNLLAQSESLRFESKRVSEKTVGNALETLCAFANSSGGTLTLGLEDPLKAMGRDRLFGIGENPEAVDELRRKAFIHLLPAVEGLRWLKVACKLRDGADGLQVPQSPKVHSILD